MKVPLTYIDVIFTIPPVSKLKIKTTKNPKNNSNYE
jgi:hypothetical protein